MNNSEKKKADPAQEAAIRHAEGPCAVIAGPGSGKTFVLTRRILHLITCSGIDPSSILVLTFSKAAALEMRTRFLGQCGREKPGQEVVFGTFHAFFYRILQESTVEKLHMIDTASRWKYLRHLCDVRPDLVPKGAGPEELQTLISRFKNGLPCRYKNLSLLVREYNLFLQNRGCVDFDDMILRCRDLFKKDPGTLRLWRERFQWILVDEFQDVSPAQYELLLMLAFPRCNLFIVGDDDQSIYGFRGADPQTMQRFLQDFHLTQQMSFSDSPVKKATGSPNRLPTDGKSIGDLRFPAGGKSIGDLSLPAEGKYVRDSRLPEGQVVFLTANYRCAPEILAAASTLIRANKNRISKTFQARAALEGCFYYRPFSDQETENAFLVRELSGMSPAELAETAVIFRTHASAGQFLSVLEKNHIAFLAEGTMRKQKETTSEREILQDILAYYRAALDLAEKGASRRDLLRIMNRPERWLSGSFLGSDRMGRNALLSGAGLERETILDLTGDLDLLMSLSPVYSIRYLIDNVGYRTFAVRFYREAGPVLDSLCEEAAGFSSPESWISRLEDLLEYSLYKGEEEQKGQGRQKTGKKAPKSCAIKAAGPGVNVITMHACKGLEFDTVYIPGLNEGNIPSRRALISTQIEEERRLLYVAMTRARRSLTLTFLEGTPDRPAAPSRFLLQYTPYRGRVL